MLPYGYLISRYSSIEYQASEVIPGQGHLPAAVRNRTTLLTLHLGWSQQLKLFEKALDQGLPNIVYFLWSI